MVDFRRKLKRASFPKETDPVKIYDALDRQAAAGPLRPVQERVLTEWYENRITDRDVIIKLNTGVGKTLIGLLALQSSINAGNGPCLYVCPTMQLAKQASMDAVKFGIKHKLHERGGDIPIEFIEGKEILITYVQRLFNGRSQFGLDNNRICNIGTIVLDDSHACIDSIKSSFSVKANRFSEIFKYLISLFEQDMRLQGDGTYLDIRDSETSSALMPVPYWSWIDKKDEVAEFMHKHQEDDELKFVYPLLKNIWEHCTAYFASSGVEIVPDYNLIERFTPFTMAKQRILMSATTQDDSFFIKGLGFSETAVLNPLTDSTAKWSGEKMILFPSQIDESLSLEAMRDFMCTPFHNDSISKVALVPSRWIADQYAKRKAAIAIGSNLDNEIEYLKKGRDYNHTVIFVNRYDGIDLADDQCRILALDSIPVFGSLSDKYEQLCREDSELITTKIAQKVEQGLGRSVRSEKDYSIILILGEDLVRFIKTSSNQRFFSQLTRKQIEIGEDVTSSVKSEGSITNPEQEFRNVLLQCLERDEDWKLYYNECMSGIRSVSEEHPFLDLIKTEKQAEIAYSRREYKTAQNIYQSISGKFTDRDLEQGWYLQQVAKCAYFSSKVESQKIQKRAHICNKFVLMPENYHYKVIESINQTALQLIVKYMSKFRSYNDLLLKTDEMLSQLAFGINSAKFETALCEAGKLLGFISERPDLDIKKGPDNLWKVPHNSEFIAFECKNEVLTSRSCINKEEVGQMNNHIGWFEKNYGTDTAVTYIHIHPTNIISSKANYNRTVRIMTPEKLSTLKANIKSFIREFAKYDLQSLNEEYIHEALSKHKLTYSNIIALYTVDYIAEQP